MSRWVVLLARAAPGLAGRDELDETAAVLAERLGGPVRIAFLDGAVPELTAVLDAAVAAGATEVVLVPFHLPADRYLHTWTRRVVGHWLGGRHRHPRIVLTAAPAPAALAEAVQQALDGEQLELDERAAPLLSPAWAAIPGFARHVLVCRGPRCLALGGATAAAALQDELERCGLGEEQVMLTGTGCLFPCTLGPVAAVYPDDVWYGGLDAPTARRVVREHLVGGVPVEQARHRRGEPGSGG